MISKERVLNRFLDYIKIDSESRYEKAFADRLASDLEDLGLEVYRDNANEVINSETGNVIGKLKGNKDGAAILFTCHMDTVSPGRGIKPIVEDGIIKTDGTTILGGDDKAGIASLIEVITHIKEENLKHPTIEFVFTIAEEIGMYGAKGLDYTKIESKIGFALDSGGEIGTIITKGPAQDKITVKIYGKAAHAGVAPQEGISAINIAAEAISNMKLLRIDEDTTANIGSINGGVVTNVVCPEVTILAEARSTVIEKLENQTSHMVELFKSTAMKYNATTDITVERLYGEFVVSEEDEIVKLAKKSLEKVGFEAKIKSSGGGSDTNILNGNGVKALNLAIGETKPHTLEESYHVEDLVKVAVAVSSIIEEC